MPTLGDSISGLENDETKRKIKITAKKTDAIQQLEKKLHQTKEEKNYEMNDWSGKIFSLDTIDKKNNNNYYYEEKDTSENMEVIIENQMKYRGKECAHAWFGKCYFLFWLPLIKQAQSSVIFPSTGVLRVTFCGACVLQDLSPHGIIIMS